MASAETAKARLLEPATVSIRINGKVAGKTKLPVNSVHEVLRETEKQALLKSRFGEHWISKEKLEIERVESKSPAEQQASTPSAAKTPAAGNASEADLLTQADPMDALHSEIFPPAPDKIGHEASRTPDETIAPVAKSRSSKGSKLAASMSLQELEAGANEGDSLCQIELGHRHRRGFGVDKNTTLAATWYQKAAIQGDPEGDASLGRMSLAGLTTMEPKNWDNAFRIFDSTAAQNEAATDRYYAGLCLIQGRGTPPNPEKAIEYLQAFALSREYNPYQREAMWELGNLYSTGRGMQRGEIKAVEWFEKAALNGHSKSRQWLETAAKKGDRRAKKSLEKIAANKQERQ